MIHQNTTTPATWDKHPARPVSWKSVAVGFLVALLTITALLGLWFGIRWYQH